MTSIRRVSSQQLSLPRCLPPLLLQHPPDQYPVQLLAVDPALLAVMILLEIGTGFTVDEERQPGGQDDQEVLLLKGQVCGLSSHQGHHEGQRRSAHLK